MVLLSNIQKINCFVLLSFFLSSRRNFGFGHVFLYKTEATNLWEVIFTIDFDKGLIIVIILSIRLVRSNHIAHVTSLLSFFSFVFLYSENTRPAEHSLSPLFCLRFLSEPLFLRRPLFSSLQSRIVKKLSVMASAPALSQLAPLF